MGADKPQLNGEIIEISQIETCKQLDSAMTCVLIEQLMNNIS